MQFYKKSKRFVVITVAIALVLANLVLPVNEKTGQAAEQSPSNPVTDASGKTTWDCVYFGNYLQNSSNPYDGKEPIKWRVLSVNGNDAFLFADKILDDADYDAAYSWDATDTTWEECSLRFWLNSTFLTEAFSESEQSAIIDTLVSNADNDVAHTIGGGDTIDKVYLLSYAEAMNAAYGFLGNRYDSPTRKMSPTNYAKSRGAFVASSGTISGCSQWWLRSPGKSQQHAACVSFGGDVDGDGWYTYYDNGVRPVLHLDLSSASWTYAGKVSAWTTEGGSSTSGSGSDSGSDSSSSDNSSSGSNGSGSSSGNSSSGSTGSGSSSGNSNSGSSGSGSNSGNSSSGSTGSGNSSSSKSVKVGDIVTRSNLKYKVLESSKSKKTVTVVGTKNKTIKKASIPNSIAIDSGIYKVIAISKNAMEGCTKLETVSIGKKVTEIGEEAFKGCKKLKTITIKSTVLKKIGKGAFYNVKKNVTLKAPKSKKSKYRKLIDKRRTAKKSSPSKKNNSSGDGPSSVPSASPSIPSASSSVPSAPTTEQCIYCHGKGTVTCTTCSGTGYWSSSGLTPAYGGIGTGGSYSTKTKCRYCTNGKKKCSFCGGKGYR